MCLSDPVTHVPKRGALLVSCEHSQSLLGAVSSLCPKLLEGMCISQGSPEKQDKQCVRIYEYICAYIYKSEIYNTELVHVIMKNNKS